MHDDNAVHGLGYTLYIIVWLGLVVLTGVTVAISGVNLKALSVTVALLVAGVKSALVMGYFMHLKYEPPVFRWMLLVLAVTFIIFIGLTFSDTLTRSQIL